MSLKSGFLSVRQQGGTLAPRWTTFWTVLVNDRVNYYVDRKGKEPKGFILLSEIADVSETNTRDKTKKIFFVETKTNGVSRTHHLCADDETRQEWIYKIMKQKTGALTGATVAPPKKTKSGKKKGAKGKKKRSKKNKGRETPSESTSDSTPPRSIGSVSDSTQSDSPRVTTDADLDNWMAKSPSNSLDLGAIGGGYGTMVVNGEGRDHSDSIVISDNSKAGFVPSFMQHFKQREEEEKRNFFGKMSLKELEELRDGKLEEVRKSESRKALDKWLVEKTDVYEALKQKELEEIAKKYAKLSADASQTHKQRVKLIEQS
mmetsp:Transcript_9689/g.10730  ORF Transcript_9689/g.10730 Transcript_9689/m.10730 type:complete len:317 (+) Transcript_9689:68-1018(+)